jgi:uncharacterized membrane protein YqjE
MFQLRREGYFESMASDGRTSTSELAANLARDGQRLARLEMELAKQELKELAVRNGIAAGLLAGSALFAFLAVLIAVPVLVVVAIPNHLIAAACWLALYVLVALGLGIAGKMLLRPQLPRKTLASLRETKEWVIRQINSAGR